MGSFGGNPRNPTRQLVICIDLEQDDIRSTAESLQSWEGAKRALQWWRSHRRALPASASVNWFVRSDVQTLTLLGDAGWPLWHLRDALSVSVANGDAVGAHPHLYRQFGDGWRNDFADVEHAWACAEVALAAHQDEFGTGCTMWRWGDRAGHPELQARLATAGVKYDLTAEPGRVGLPSRRGRGRVPSFVGHPTQPHRTTDGIVDWPTTTCALSRLTPAAGCVRAIRPVGTFDDITDAWIEGWCSDLDEDRGRPVDVELLIDGVVVEVTAAEWFREDLRAAGYRDGRHGVRIGMRDEWRGLPSLSFSLRPAGHVHPLASPPIDVRTERGVEATILPVSLDTEPELFARMVAVLLDGDATHLTIATRSEVFLDPVKAAHVERNCRTLLGHIRADRLTEPRSVAAAAAAALV